MNGWLGVATLSATLVLCALTWLFAPSDRSNLFTRLLAVDQLFENVATRDSGPASRWSSLRGAEPMHPGMMGGPMEGPLPFLEKTKKKCIMMAPIAECHRTCGRDLACHKQCPLPECKRMRGKIEGAMACHEQCAVGDMACHHSCPRPFQRLREKCAAVMCHEQCAHGDFSCHTACPQPGRGHDGSNKPLDRGMEHVQEAIERKFVQLRMAFIHCAEQCGEDETCREKCVNPWDQVQEQCDSMKPIMECHGKCRGDPACHGACPVPESSIMQNKVKEAIQCHGACGKEPQCHVECPAPLMWAAEKCTEFGKVHACHKACARSDFACHRACPHPGHEGDQVHGEGSWHHHHHHHHHHGGEHEEHGHHHRHGDEQEDYHGHEEHDHHHHRGDGHEAHRWGGHWGHHASKSHGDDQHHGDDQEHRHGSIGMSHSKHGEQYDEWKQHWQQAMQHRMECKTKCGADEACSGFCPRPWEMVLEKCGKMKPVFECHEDCHHDLECHRKCPLPACQKMASKIQDTIQCHSACGNDGPCHEQCPRALDDAREVCGKMDEVHTCHVACQHGDLACHEACPKLFELTL